MSSRRWGRRFSAVLFFVFAISGVFAASTSAQEARSISNQELIQKLLKMLAIKGGEAKIVSTVGEQLKITKKGGFKSHEISIKDDSDGITYSFGQTDDNSDIFFMFHRIKGNLDAVRFDAQGRFIRGYHQTPTELTPLSESSGKLKLNEAFNVWAEQLDRPAEKALLSEENNFPLNHLMGRDSSAPNVGKTDK